MTMIQTKRLLLRKITYHDFDEVAKMLRDIDVMYAWEHTFTDKQIYEWIDRRLEGYKTYGYDYFLAVERGSGRVAGQIGLLQESVNGESVIGIGYILNKEFWHMGYAAEGAKACLDYAFSNLHTHKVICDIRPQNKPSIRVAEKIGMVKAGEFVKTYHGKDMLHFIYEKQINIYRG